MAHFTIPAPFQKGFELLFALSSAKRKKLLEEIKHSKAGLSTADLIKEVSKSLKIDAHECEAMIATIISLFEAKNNTDTSLEEFIDGIIFALKATKNKKLKPSPNLKQQLRQLLNSEHTFALTLRANNLATERERILSETEITTDIRPIFDEKNKKIDAATILHNLKLKYYKDGRAREEYFSLSADDIKKLKQQIADAENKELMLRKEIKLLYIDVK